MQRFNWNGARAQQVISNSPSFTNAQPARLRGARGPVNSGPSSASQIAELLAPQPASSA